jgi:hypothetical protein
MRGRYQMLPQLDDEPVVVEQRVVDVEEEEELRAHGVVPITLFLSGSTCSLHPELVPLASTASDGRRVTSHMN